MSNLPGAAAARGAKRLGLKRFPYDIVVWHRSQDIPIVVVAHRSWRPGYWRDRLKV